MDNIDRANALPQPTLLPGDQRGRGVTDPFSFDTAEQSQFDIERQVQDAAVQAGMFDADVLTVPSGPVEFDFSAIEQAQAPARIKQSLRIENIAGTVGTASVRVRVPSDCRLIRAHCAANLCTIGTTAKSAYAAQTLDAAQNDLSIASFAAGLPAWIPVRTQWGEIFIAASAADTQIQLVFYCGDINLDDYII
jgi:hypothetical protein